MHDTRICSGYLHFFGRGTTLFPNSSRREKRQEGMSKVHMWWYPDASSSLLLSFPAPALPLSLSFAFPNPVSFHWTATGSPHRPRNCLPVHTPPPVHEHTRLNL